MKKLVSGAVAMAFALAVTGATSLVSAPAFAQQSQKTEQTQKAPAKKAPAKKQPAKKKGDAKGNETAKKPPAKDQKAPAKKQQAAAKAY